MKFIELTCAGGLELDKVTFRVDHIVAVQKPKKDTFSCIVETVISKLPVKESYDEVRNMIGVNDN